MELKNCKVERIEKKVCAEMLNKYHYLGKQGYSFRSGYNFGLYYEDILIGVAVFHTVSAPETVQGCFGLARNEQDGIWELGRLAILPEYNGKNYTSWFLARAIKQLRKTDEEESFEKAMQEEPIQLKGVKEALAKNEDMEVEL